MKRYDFILCGLIVLICTFSCKVDKMEKKVTDLLSQEVIRRADNALSQEIVTITAFPASRSEGTIHDFYSEGDYWWPDPENPEGPYLRRDGLTNPDNFVAHRKCMIRMSILVGDLTSAYLVTRDTKYAQKAIQHIYAWFGNTPTAMSPHLLYAQAIKGVASGRGIGIIDTIHLVEVARSLQILINSGLAQGENALASIEWFRRYTGWMSTHPYGVAEMNAKNNHGTCWFLQVAAFSQLTGDKEKLDFCADRYKTILLPRQMADNGSFPLELERTKPYGYSLFNLDAMTALAYILKDSHNLWNYTDSRGVGIRTGIEYLIPYVAEKQNWPLDPDVMYWEEWPVAQPFLLFKALADNDPHAFSVWSSLDHFPQTDEVVRNLPIRNPLLWLDI